MRKISTLLIILLVIGCNQDNYWIDYKSNENTYRLDDSLTLHLNLYEDKTIDGIIIYDEELVNKGIIFNEKSNSVNNVFSNLKDGSTVYYVFYENGTLKRKTYVQNNLKTKDYQEYYDSGEIYSYRYYLKEGKGKATFGVRYNKDASVDFENLKGSSLVYLDKKVENGTYIFKTVVPPYFDEKLYYIFEGIKKDSIAKNVDKSYHLPIPEKGDSIIIDITLTNRINGQNFSEEIILGH